MSILLGENRQRQEACERRLDELNPDFPQWHLTAIEHLPILPLFLRMVLSPDVYVVSQKGTGGKVLDSGLMLLGVDPHFPDLDAQRNNLRGTYLHETYHAAQRLHAAQRSTGSNGISRALAIAITEGSASRFENNMTGGSSPFTDYDHRTTAEMVKLIRVVQSLPDDFDEYRWKHFDPDSREPWRLYRAGVFVVDRTLASNPSTTLEELVAKSPSEIFDLSGLA